MRQLSVIDDPVHQEKSYNSVESFFLQFIRDERDLPFFFLILKISCTVIPLSVALFLTEGPAWWAIAALFTGLQLYHMGPFILMLHNTSHNMFFKREYKLGNRFIPWALCPFMGQSPDTYFSHHIGMHHAENNLEHDRSSTMPYQRDSFIDFMKYFGRFLFIGILEMVSYFKFRKKEKFARRAVTGEVTFFLVCILLGWFDWQSTLVVLVIPLVLVRFLMMCGNWAQHAFIATDAPADNYRNSITCINSTYNKRCFNDGYHIGHHLKPHMHWTDMPKDFLANAGQYAGNKAIVFESLDYHQIWALLMLKRYDMLANYVVNINETYRSKEEVMEMMKQRTRKFTASA